MECDGLVFCSDFCSGNLKCARRNGAYVELEIRRDCEGTEFERRSATWFYFRVRDDSQKKRKVTFKLLNMNRQGALYKNGYKVFVQRDDEWSRIASTSFLADDALQKATVTWDHTFRNDEVAFAFCYPYSYEDLQKSLGVAEEKAKRCGAYFQRELLCYSLERRRVDLLTITEPDDHHSRRQSLVDASIKQERPEVDEGGAVFDEAEASLERKVFDSSWLLPLARLGSESRPLAFDERRVVLVSCRVHPGETPASYLLDGILEALLEDSAVAKELRSKFLWRIVPMLNPDGVAKGHYRHDSRGVDLNRVYGDDCDPRLYPGPAALLAMAKDSKKLVLFLDLHAHATKRGIFAYGNNVHEHVQNKLYPLIVAANTQNTFDYDACDFSETRMANDGSARVGLHRAANGVPCYTIESNYNGSQRRSLDSRRRREAHLEYTPAIWRSVGRALAVSVLDLENDTDRIKASRYQSLDAMRHYLKKRTTFPQQRRPLQRKPSITTTKPTPRNNNFRDTATTTTSYGSTIKTLAHTSRPTPPNKKTGRFVFKTSTTQLCAPLAVVAQQPETKPLLLRRRPVRPYTTHP